MPTKIKNFLYGFVEQTFAPDRGCVRPAPCGVWRRECSGIVRCPFPGRRSIHGRRKPPRSPAGDAGQSGRRDGLSSAGRNQDARGKNGAPSNVFHESLQTPPAKTLFPNLESHLDNFLNLVSRFKKKFKCELLYF